MKIGILALQGGFSEHEIVLKKLNINTILIKSKKDLIDLNGIILPGGESTAIGLLLEKDLELLNGLKDLIFNSKVIVWGTCAGLILLSENLDQDKKQTTLGGLPIKVKRNGYGRQLESFIRVLDFTDLPGLDGFPGVFIRAPKIIVSDAQDLKVLARVDGEAVAIIKDNRIIGTSFHPELMIDNLIALVDNQNLIIYEIKSKKGIYNIPLERIVRLESDLYRHELILDQQLPELKLLYQKKVSPTMNQLEEIVLKTTRKEWALPHLLRSRIRTKNLGLFYKNLDFEKVDFKKECESLINAYLINDKAIVADTAADTVQALIPQTCINQTAKFKLFSTCLIDILVNEIDQTFKWLKKSTHIAPPSNVPKFVILKRGGKEIAKMLPSIPSPTHPTTISNSLYFSSLCLDWITSGVFDNDISTIKIPRLEFNTNESEISILDLVNDISDQLILYDVDDPSFSNLCTSLCSLASEIALGCTDIIRFTQPEFLAGQCVNHLKKWKSPRFKCDQDLLHAYRHSQLIYFLLKTLQISTKTLRNIPDYKYITNLELDLKGNSNERIRLITITNEILFLVTQ